MQLFIRFAKSSRSQILISICESIDAQLKFDLYKQDQALVGRDITVISRYPSGIQFKAKLVQYQGG